MTLSTVLCLPTSSEKATIVPSALKMAESWSPPVSLKPLAKAVDLVNGVKYGLGFNCELGFYNGDFFVMLIG